MRKRLALAGFPIAHSLSPRMQQAGMDALSLDARYELRPTEAGDLAIFIDELHAGVWFGGNVTTPIKTEVAPLCVGDAIVQRCGAVNTLWVRDGVLYGALTDVDGVREPLAARDFGATSLPGHALILGAGGAARAAAIALEQLNLRVSVAARDAAKAAEVVRFVDPALRGDALSLASCATPGALREVGVIIQATSVGRSAETLALDWASASPDLVAFEMLYVPRETAFLRAARSHGAQIIEGWEMLLAQGLRAFEIWFEREAPRDVMREALLSGLSL
ncbi:MAG: shikimate dehydrogenase [Clostridia bacterium]|nr:shikimate dehydrogenase [Deltaproteobacteria bacterium]